MESPVLRASHEVGSSVTVSVAKTSIGWPTLSAPPWMKPCGESPWRFNPNAAAGRTEWSPAATAALLGTSSSRNRCCSSECVATQSDSVPSLAQTPTRQSALETHEFNRSGWSRTDSDAQPLARRATVTSKARGVIGRPRGERRCRSAEIRSSPWGNRRWGTQSRRRRSRRTAQRTSSFGRSLIARRGKNGRRSYEIRGSRST